MNCYFGVTASTLIALEIIYFSMLLAINIDLHLGAGWNT